MKLRVISASIVVTALLFSGCTTTNQPEANTTPSVKSLTTPTPHVKELIDKYKLEIVDYS